MKDVLRVRMWRRDESVALLSTAPRFRWFWAGQTAAAVGAQVTAFALPLVTSIALGAGPDQVGLVATAGWLPYLLFSLLAGHWLEGRDRCRSMLVGQGVQVLALGSIPLLSAASALSVPLLAVAAFVSGCGALVVALAGFAYLPDLVAEREIGAANRALQGSRTVAQVAGPGLAGALVGALGPALAVVADAAGQLLAMAGIARSGVRSSVATGREGGGTGRARFLDGLRVLFVEPHLRALTVHAAIYNLTTQVFMLDLVLLAVRHEHVSTFGYGLALGASGVGGVIGTAVALRLSRRWGFGRAFVASLALSCGAPITIPLSGLHGTAFVILIGATLFVAGIGLGSANIYSLTLRQTIIPRPLLTRSAGAYTQVMYGSIPIGAALAGVFGTWLGVRQAVLVGAVGYIVSALPIAFSRIRQMRTGLPIRAEAATSPR